MQDPITNNIHARTSFLGLVAEVEPNVCSGPEALAVGLAYVQHIAQAEVNSALIPNFFGYARINLIEAKNSKDLNKTLNNWASKFNLQADWCLDHLLQAIAIQLILEGPVNDRNHRAWSRAMTDRNSNVRSVIFGPKLKFEYSWPTHLSTDKKRSFVIEVNFHNPLKVLNKDCLRDIRDRFTAYVTSQLSARNSQLDAGEPWVRVEQIAREVLAFGRKLDAFERKAKKSVKEYMNQLRKRRKYYSETWHPVFHVSGREISRNIRWLMMYQVKGMSYGAIANLEDTAEISVIAGVKAGADLIDLKLRHPNKAGRKKGSQTNNSTLQIVR